MDDEFGQAYAAVILNDLALQTLSDRTGKACLDAGEDPKAVWLAICQTVGVPEERWHGKPAKNKKTK